jgi:ribosomal-protein-alanine N-acetyltransferase
MSIEKMFSQFPVLTTERLVLRQFRPEDTEAVFAITSDPAVREVTGHEPHRSLDEAHQLAQRRQKLYEDREAIIWAVTLKGEDTVIGDCLFWNFGPDFHYAETGYELNSEYWRQGITTEAMKAVLAYGFTELDLHRIEAVVSAENQPSSSLLLKMGFKLEGTLRQRWFFRDRFIDEQYFGLLKDEWAKR